MLETFLRKMRRPAEVVKAAIASDLKKIPRSDGRAYEVVPLPGGASNRGYCRITFPGADSDRLQSLILMVLADPDPHQGIEEAASYAARIRELPFVNVQKHLAAAGVAVPELYFYNVELGLLYMEDFGDVLLRNRVQGRPEAEHRTWMEAAIDELVKLQVAGTRRQNDQFLGFMMRFDHELLYWELNHFTDYAIRDRFPGALRPEDEATIDRHFESITHRLLTSRYLLQHRDWHLDNLMVHDGRIKVIDFQDALMGPFPYDLACLLYDRDTSAILGDELIEHLVQYYGDRFEKADGQPLGRAHYREIFDLCVLHRMFKVVGRFHYINSVKKRPEYLVFLPPMHAALKKYLAAHPELAELHEVVGRYVTELAGAPRLDT
jgi:N-acetylmuramate 1-kinase